MPVEIAVSFPASQIWLERALTKLGEGEGKGQGQKKILSNCPSMINHLLAL